MIGGIIAKSLQVAYSWHAVYFAGATMTAVVFVVLWIWLPESIDYLNSKQPQNAKARLNKIAHKLGFAGEWDLTSKAEKMAVKLPIWELFGKKISAFYAIIMALIFCDYVLLLLHQLVDPCVVKRSRNDHGRELSMWE